MDQLPSTALSRRGFVRAAVALGGTSALSACLAREGADLPAGPSVSARTTGSSST